MPAFIANIPTLLQAGDRIDIGGKIKENARKMSINLCAQDGEEPKDVVLHFDVRFHRDNIISLSRKNGMWIGSGNYDTNYNMFVPGTLFRIVFEVKDTDVITIYCQGKFHSNFLPKIPITMARYVVAWADIDRITHCYFHNGSQASRGDDNMNSVAYIMRSPRTSPLLVGDSKQTGKPKSPRHRSLDSSEEDKQRGRNGNRTNKFFCDAMVCQPTRYRITQETNKRNEPCTTRHNPELKQRFKQQLTEMDGHTSEDVSEEIASKDYDDSSVLDSEVVLPYLGIKKRVRRGKFEPITKMVNYMGTSMRKS